MQNYNLVEERQEISDAVADSIKNRDFLAGQDDPKPKARMTRFCHSKIDEMSCNMFLNMMRRFDQNKATAIINECLMPDIQDLRQQKIKGPRNAIRTALESANDPEALSSVVDSRTAKHIVKLKKQPPPRFTKIASSSEQSPRFSSSNR